MYKHKNKYKICSKLVATTITLLVLISNIAWTLPSSHPNHSGHALQVMSIFAPILNKIERQNQSRAMFELYTMVDMAWKKEEIQDINSALDIGYSSTSQKDKNRIFDIIQKISVQDGGVIVYLEIFEGPQKGKMFRILLPGSNLDFDRIEVEELGLEHEERIHSFIGKAGYIEGIWEGEGHVKIKLRDSNGNIQTIISNSPRLLGKEEIKVLIGAITRKGELNNVHKEILTTIYSLLLEREPLNISIFEDRVDDMLGFISEEDDLILFLHKDLSWKYYLMYLYGIMFGLVKRGDISLRLNGDVLLISIKDKEIELDVSWALKSLREDKESWANWPEQELNLNRNQRYLIRILHRETYREDDIWYTRRLSLIKEYKLFQMPLGFNDTKITTESSDIFLPNSPYLAKMTPYLNKLYEVIPKERVELFLSTLKRYEDILLFSHFLIGVDRKNLYSQLGQYFNATGRIIPPTKILRPFRFNELHSYGSVDEIFEREAIAITEFVDFLNVQENKGLLLSGAFENVESIWSYFEEKPGEFYDFYYPEEIEDEAVRWHAQDFLLERIFSKEGQARMIEYLKTKYGISVEGAKKIIEVLSKYKQEGYFAIKVLERILRSYSPKDKVEFEKFLVMLTEKAKADEAERVYLVLEKLIQRDIFDERLFSNLINALKGKTSVVVFEAFGEHIEILKDFKDKGFLRHHLDFFAEIASRYGNKAGLIIEGIINGIKMEIIGGELTEEEQENILKFITRMNIFSPILYRAYSNSQEPEDFLEQLRNAGRKILADKFNKDDIEKLLRLSMAEDERSKGEFLFAVYCTVIPTTDNSWVRTDEAIELILGSNQLERDTRDDIPRALRGYERTFDITTVKKVKRNNDINHRGAILQWVCHLKTRFTSEEPVSEEDFREYFLSFAKRKMSNLELREKLEIYLRQNTTFQAQLKNILREEDYYIQLGKISTLVRDIIKELLRDPLDELKKASLRSCNGNNGALNGGFWGPLQKAPLERLGAILGKLPAKHLKLVKDKLDTEITDADRRSKIREMVDTLIKARSDEEEYVRDVNIIEEVWGAELKLVDEEFKNFVSIKDAQKKVSLRVVKGAPYVLYGMNCGLCIARDFDLWEDPHYFLLSIVDEESGLVEGFVQLYDYVMEIEGKKRRILFVPGINPTTKLIGETNETEFFNKVIGTIQEIARIGEYDVAYMPQDEYMYTNRIVLRKVVQERDPSFRRVTLPRKIKWIKNRSKYLVTKVFDLISEGPDLEFKQEETDIESADNTNTAQVEPDSLDAASSSQDEERLKRRGEHAITSVNTISKQLIFDKDSLKTYDVSIDVVIDLALIPKKDLEENMKTWAYLILQHISLGNINFIFEKPNTNGNAISSGRLLEDINNAPSEGEALSELKKQLSAIIGLFPDLDVDIDRLFKERINAPRQNNAVEIPIYSKAYLRWLKSYNFELRSNQYPVALDGYTVDKGQNNKTKVAFRSFQAALTMGLAKAAMVIARQRDEKNEKERKNVEKELPELKKKLLGRLQVLYNIFRDDIVITEKTLDNMIHPASTVRMNLAIYLALPSIVKMAVHKLKDLHNAAQLLLQSA